jgi:integrase
MKWTDLDLPEGQWTLQATVTKSKRLAIVPLSKLAIGILAGLPRLEPYVFAGASGNKPISGYSTAMTKLGSLPGGEAIKHWTFHDLRRTAATEMGRLDTPEDIIGKVSNHSAKGITG